MPVELPDSYQALYDRAHQQMSIGNIDAAAELMLRIVNRLGRLRPQTMARKPDLAKRWQDAWFSALEFLRWDKKFNQTIEV